MPAGTNLILMGTVWLCVIRASRSQYPIATDNSCLAELRAEKIVASYEADIKPEEIEFLWVRWFPDPTKLIEA